MKLRTADLDNANVLINSIVDDLHESVLFEADIRAFPTVLAARELTLSVGAKAVMTIPAVRLDDMIFHVDVAFDELRSLSQYDIRWTDDSGTDISFLLDYRLTGEFFDAITLSAAPDFFTKIQLNHCRYTSPFLLEVGARAAYRRFDQHFVVQAAALTVIAHRFLELPVSALRPDDPRISWLLEQAALVIARGEKRIAAAASPAWEDARWTISLATVAGYLSLIGDRYTRAEKFFAVPVRYVNLVAVAKVSALNIVNGCFVHGMLAHVLGRNDIAIVSLTTGVQSLPAIVAAQNLMENVWVIGDLMNVMRSARQCFIALVRLKLMARSSPATGLVIGDATQLLISDVTGPLHDILLGGRSALIARVVAASGGTI